jgi:hypothetical protein
MSLNESHERPDVKLGSKEALERGIVQKQLNEKVWPALQNGMKHPMTLLQEQSRQSWSRIAHVQSHALPDFSQIQAEHSPEDQKTVQTALKSLEAIKQLEPDEEVTGGDAQRYLKTNVIAKNSDGPAILYAVKQDVVKADIEQLKLMTKVYPQHAGQLNQLIGILQQLRVSDPAGYASTEAAQVRKDAPASKALGFMGKSGAIILLAAAALLSGSMMLARKKFSVAPFLYAGILLWMVNPKAFSPKEQRVMQDASNLLTNKDFVERIAPRYSFQGKDGADSLESLIKMENKNHPLLKKYDNGSISQEEMTELLDELAPANSSKRAMTQELLNNKKDFKLLRSYVSGIKSDEALALIRGYTEQATWKQAKNVPMRKPATLNQTPPTPAQPQTEEPKAA